MSFELLTESEQTDLCETILEDWVNDDITPGMMFESLGMLDSLTGEEMDALYESYYADDEEGEDALGEVWKKSKGGMRAFFGRLKDSGSNMMRKWKAAVSKTKKFMKAPNFLKAYKQLQDGKIKKKKFMGKIAAQMKKFGIVLPIWATYKLLGLAMGHLKQTYSQEYGPKKGSQMVRAGKGGSGGTSIFGAGTHPPVNTIMEVFTKNRAAGGMSLLEG